MVPNGYTDMAAEQGSGHDFVTAVDESGLKP